jgi:hypothetical protein
MSKVVTKNLRRQLKLVVQQPTLENIPRQKEQINQLKEAQLLGVLDMDALQQWEVGNQ